MSNRKEITKQLSEMLEEHLNPNNDPRIYTAKEVTFDYSTLHPIRVDYMRFKPIDNTIGGIEQGVFYCYEIKSCIEDYNSGNGLNFIGDYNYLVMPRELYEKLSSVLCYGPVGVYIPNENEYGLYCVKKAKKRMRKRSVTEMLLMMFRSSNRELIKARRKTMDYETKH